MPEKNSVRYKSIVIKKVDTLVQEMCNENCSYFISPSTTLHRHTMLLSWRPGKDLPVLTWAERDRSVVEWMWALDAKYLLGRVLLQKDFDQNGEEILHQPHHLVDAECLQVVGAVKSWRQARRKNYWKSATGWAQRRCWFWHNYKVQLFYFKHNFILIWSEIKLILPLI